MRILQEKTDEQKKKEEEEKKKAAEKAEKVHLRKITLSCVF